MPLDGSTKTEFIATQPQSRQSHDYHSSCLRTICLGTIPYPRRVQVAELEQRIGVRFPDDYRRFLLGFNGGYFKEPEITPVGEGCPLDTLEILFGIGASHWEAELCTTATMGSFDDNSPPKIVPIGRTGMGGLIILDDAPGEGRGSIFLKKAFGDFYFLVEELEAFFALLRRTDLGLNRSSAHAQGYAGRVRLAI